jgi:cation:H+ antiporter
MLLLAAATSLPEVATTVTAIVIVDNPTLAVHDLLGGVALQTALLAVADRFKGRRGALTFFSPRFVLLIEGVGLVFLLQLTTAGMMARGVPAIASVSAWSIAIFLGYVGVMLLVYRHRGQPRWTPTRADDVPDEVKELGVQPASEGRGSARAAGLSFAAMSLVVLVGGWLATETTDALARQTGIGSAFLGATLLALATSLPELSTTIAAVRGGRYTAAISNIYGSNAFDVTLLVLADILYRKGTVLAHAERSVVFVAAVGSIMTCTYLWGLMERENRSVLGIGWDSAAAVALYAAGMVVLYFIQ